ncbi:two-component system response regulator DegU [Planomicrobium stackebrandtii]|uniref:Two-component system response regulator DegU n=1 Tax=Planomicrobium stackebrandtii TaxID=253160 RepID=A0ABU0GQB9_9BACL|nr:response regulator transcription factor [Planomicrobium stackebrandtii]MDQ0427546.1 two-component system response regulator DegU [Planomicrobium stackebrandtii]
MHPPHTEGIFPVVLADTNRLLGEGLKLILNDLGNEFSIIDQQSGLFNLRASLEDYSSKIILAELFSGDSLGITELQNFISEYPKAKVVVYSVSKEKEHVLETLKYGAVGYLSKGAEISTVIEALRTVSRGYYYIDPWLAQFLVKEIQQLHGKINDKEHFSIQIADPCPELLTKREMEIIRLLTEGQSNKSIGEVLHISEKTVKNHVSKMLAKLKLVDRTQIVLKAIKSGWVAL